VPDSGLPADQWQQLFPIVAEGYHAMLNLGEYTNPRDIGTEHDMVVLDTSRFQPLGTLAIQWRMAYKKSVVPAIVRGPRHWK